MKYGILYAFLFLILEWIPAQGDLQSKEKGQINDDIDLYPSFQMLKFEFGQSFERDFDSKLNQMKYSEGELGQQQNFKMNGNIPFFVSSNKKWIMSATLNYGYHSFRLNDINRGSVYSVKTNNGELYDFHNFSTTFNSTFFSTLFGKTVIYNFSIIGDGNNKGYERLKTFAGASIVLKKTKTTTLTIGLLAFIDPTSQIPFAPVFSYRLDLPSFRGGVDLTLPSHVLLRKKIGHKIRLSAGSVLSGTGFYVKPDVSELPEIYEYSQIEINTGIIGDYRLSSKLTLSFQGGISHFVSNRLTEKGEETQNYIYKNNQNSSFYFKTGIAFNPF